MARWQSGYAAACKAVDAGSIPTLASISFFAQARVAELVDATDLKSVFRKEVWVRVPPRAPANSLPLYEFAYRRHQDEAQDSRSDGYTNRRVTLGRHWLVSG